MLFRSMHVRLQSDVTSISRNADGTLRVVLLESGNEREVEVDTVMYATGRLPNTANLGLDRVGVELSTEGAVVVVYGPFRRADLPAAPSNEAFDEDLRRRNPAWGLRQLEDVDAIARQYDFDRVATVDMPANNLTVVFRKERRR